MSVDSDDISAQPLATLLQNVTDFVKAPSSPLARRKLRPEVIEIQRTKDVGIAQPVSFLALFPLFFWLTFLIPSLP